MIFTKDAMFFRSMRISETDLRMMQAAAAAEVTSQSEFLRRAIRARAKRLLARTFAKAHKQRTSSQLVRKKMSDQSESTGRHA